MNKEYTLTFLIGKEIKAVNIQIKTGKKGITVNGINLGFFKNEKSNNCMKCKYYIYCIKTKTQLYKNMNRENRRIWDIIQNWLNEQYKCEEYIYIQYYFKEKLNGVHNIEIKEKV